MFEAAPRYDYKKKLYYVILYFHIDIYYIILIFNIPNTTLQKNSKDNLSILEYLIVLLIYYFLLIIITFMLIDIVTKRKNVMTNANFKNINEIELVDNRIITYDYFSEDNKSEY